MSEWDMSDFVLVSVGSGERIYSASDLRKTGRQMGELVEMWYHPKPEKEGKTGLSPSSAPSPEIIDDPLADEES